jgi:hypothetical protein
MPRTPNFIRYHQHSISTRRRNNHARIETSFSGNSTQYLETQEVTSDSLKMSVDRIKKERPFTNAPTKMNQVLPWDG